MSNDVLVQRVHTGMQIITADDVVLGKIWQVHFRDAEAFIEIRPRTFWNAIEDMVIEVPRHANTSHLFIPAQTITHVLKKRVYLNINAANAKTYISRPPWIERGDIPPTGFNTPRLE